MSPRRRGIFVELCNHDAGRCAVVALATVLAWALHATPAQAFVLTGLSWPADALPFEYELNERGSDDLSFEQLEQLFADSFSAWTEVACTSIEVSYLGPSPREAALDEHHVMSFRESGWTLGADTLAAAGTSVLSLDPLVLTADITFNGETITWRVGGGGANPRIIDPQNVMTHEIGHILGLSHTLSDGSATMSNYYLWDLGQRSLSHDDKAGICTLYPRAGSSGECEPQSDTCPAGSHCGLVESWWLCVEQRDGLEAPCSIDRINCQDLCAFTRADLKAGFCTRLCSEDSQCEPEGQCRPFGTVQVCLLAEPGSEEQPEWVDSTEPSPEEQPEWVDEEDPNLETEAEWEELVEPSLDDEGQDVETSFEDVPESLEELEEAEQGDELAEAGASCACSTRRGKSAWAWLVVVFIPLLLWRRRPGSA